jgi:uncharacterized protein (TIGR02453 family)
MRKRTNSETSLPSSFDDENIISIVKIPEKPRPKKKIKEVDGQIEDYVLEFLEDLKNNNEKEWMDLNRKVYEGSKENFIDFVSFQLKQIQNVDSTLSHIDHKKTLFRINRDSRFSADKSIYKTYFASAFSRGSKKDGDAFYYLHLEPNDKSIIAAGIYSPSTAILTRIRTGIVQNVQALKDSLSGKDLLEALQVESGEEHLKAGKKSLKNAPKGFPKDHPEIDLLRLQSYTIGKTFTDAEVLSSDFPMVAAKCLQSFKPFVYCLNRFYDARFQT